MSIVPSVSRLFKRVSGGQPNIDRPKVEGYLKDLGVGSGLLGGQKVKQGADWFMSKFDNAPKDGVVTWKEFVANGRHLVPPGIADDKGHLSPAKVSAVFDEIAGSGTPKASKESVASYIEPKITGMAAMFAGTIADATAKFAVDALDADGDGAFTRDDLTDLVKDINKEIGEPA